MPRQQSRRLAQAASVALAATVLAALSAAPVRADSPAPAAAGSVQGGSAPHLDAVEHALRQISPGLEGTIWQRTAGNALDAPTGDPAGWLLQTPACWGDPACTNRPGTQQLLARMTSTIATATRTVDISTLAPFPNGGFEDAIVAGLKAAVAGGNKLQVRILVGAAPLLNITALPTTYRDELVGKLGDAAGSVTLTVASMTTSRTAFAWNHSKLLVVDGQRVVTGGINNWKDDYLDTTHPVSDVDLALAGPAATTAGRYLDTLWGWTCRNTGLLSAAWFAASSGASCDPTLEQDANPAPAAATGTTPVIAVGGLGVGIQDTDPTSTGQFSPAAASDTSCGPISVPDYTNTDRDYATVNPEETALRALVASATSHVEISQQDLNGTCPPMPRYDVKLYDTLAAKLAAGVKVRIVVSDPANRGTVGSGGYSQITSLSEISDTLLDHLTTLTGSGQAAHATMCQNLQLASFRAAAAPTWADGRPYALHHKLVSVDGSAFYIGSKNLYPAYLQDFGYIVEDPTAAGQLDANLLTPEWQYSQAAATFDYARGVCG